MSAHNKKPLLVSITSEQEGQRLDRVLGLHPDIGSRSKAAQLIDSGDVTLRNLTVKASQLVKHDEVYSVQIPISPDESRIEPLNINLNIIYEDSDVIVVNKPAGLVVHPAAGHRHDTLVNALVNYTQDLSMGFNEMRPGIVHRIDKDTSGLIVIAKNDFSHMKLASQFKKKSIHRVYWAIVHGVVKPPKGTIKSFISRHTKDRKKFASNKSEKGKASVTHYELINTFHNHVSLVHFKLETGRTHQIRVHISEKGHPIIGDTLYGSISRTKKLQNSELKNKILEMRRFALHAAELGFEHPRSGKYVEFKSDWPDDLLPIVQFLNFL